MNPLAFDRDLARFQRELEAQAEWDGGGWESSAIAVSYLHLLGRLAETGDAEVNSGLVAEAIAAYDQAAGQLRPVAEEGWRRARAWEEAQSQRRAAEHDEALRRHKLAVTVECPFCGVPAGKVCHTVPTGDGAAATRGVHDHRDRYRAAEHLFGPPGDDSDDELPF